MEIFYTSRFMREVKKIPRATYGLLDTRISIFKQNPFDPRLKAHKLSGRLAGCYAFSIDYHYRILFQFKDSGSVLFRSIGDHSIYD